MKSSPPVHYRPLAGTLAESELDRLLERSLKAAFGDEAWLRHSHTDKTYKLGRAYNSGEPDYVGVIHGLFVAIENKIHPNYPRDAQLAYLRRVVRHGGLAFLLVHDGRQGQHDGYFLIPCYEPPVDFSWRTGTTRQHWISLPYINYGTTGILNLHALHGLVVMRVHQLHQTITKGTSP